MAIEGIAAAVDDDIVPDHHARPPTTRARRIARSVILSRHRDPDPPLVVDEISFDQRGTVHRNSVAILRDAAVGRAPGDGAVDRIVADDNGGPSVFQINGVAFLSLLADVINRVALNE